MNKNEIRKSNPSYWVTYLLPQVLDVPLPNICFLLSKSYGVDIDTFDISIVPKEAENAIGLFLSYGFLGKNGGIILNELQIFKGVGILTLTEAKELFPDTTFYPSLDELIKNDSISGDLKSQIISKDDLSIQYSKFIETCKKMDSLNYADALASIHDENISSSDVYVSGIVLLTREKYPHYLYNTDFVILTDN